MKGNTPMAKSLFSGKKGQTNLLIALGVAGVIAAYLYKKKQDEKKAVVSGLLPAYRG